MQILILAAGMGKRLADLTNNATKCMVEVNGVPLINRALDTVLKYSPDRIVLVVGYEGDKLKEYLGDNYEGVPIVYVNNSIYDTTNNIYSLYLAKEYLCDQDTLLLESDLIFDESVINKLLSMRDKDNVVLVDKYQSWMDGTVVKIDSEGKILHFISKNDFDFTSIEEYYKTVNIYWFKKEFSNLHYVPFLEAYCQSVGHNEYYENVLKVLAFMDNLQLNACVLEENCRWYEIDDKQDLHNAETLFSENISSYQSRYGGYWRFPFLKDFCYLVNPYFPPKQMVEEYKAHFETLLHDYPSTGAVQSLLAAKMFDCEPNQVLVGNGAAELISNLMDSFDQEKVGVMVPTFHEYISRTPKEHIVTLEIDNENFEYNIDTLKGFSNSIDNLLLINPDNPSGNFISKKDVVELLDFLKSKNKRLILDESFVDFSTENDENSLIDKDIIEKYDNLIIIKSISKSYGVPGIRLGVMISSNSKLLSFVKDKLPVWNINSYGEFFFQIFGKYSSEYKKASVKISKERDRLFSKLKEISYLRPIYSQANYFLCEVKTGTATELTKYMMKNYNILLKDCTGKAGFKNKEYVRIAVRDTVDNDYLIKAFMHYKI